jgi:hypothetical protein
MRLRLRWETGFTSEASAFGGLPGRRRFGGDDERDSADLARFGR